MRDSASASGMLCPPAGCPAACLPASSSIVDHARPRPLTCLPSAGVQAAVSLVVAPMRPGIYNTYLVVENLDNVDDLKIIRLTASTAAGGVNVRPLAVAAD